MKNSINNSGLKSSGSLQNLGKSIMSSKNLNSFTVREVKANPLQHSGSISKIHADNSLNLNSMISNRVKDTSYISNASRYLPNPSNVSTPKILKSPSAEMNSIRYLKRKIEPQLPPADLKFSVFAIYESGNGYDKGRRAYGMPKGIGILLNENLCLTTASVFKDESDVINSFMQLKDGSIFKFDPYRAFTSLEGKFAITAFRLVEVKVLQTFKPINIKVPFELNEGDSVFYFPFDNTKSKSVLTVSNEEFAISSGKVEYMLPGNPIFTLDWVIQGIFVSSEGHINKILRISTILDYMDQSIYLIHNPLLEKFTRQNDSEYVEKFHNRYLYYFEWGTQIIWRYDIDTESWNNVKIHNLEEVNKQSPLWSFGMNSRSVYLPDSRILSIGGYSINTNIELRDVISFNPQEFQTVKMLSEMLVPRAGAAIVYCNNYVYAFGGKPNPKTCEKYSIASDRWIPIASMYYPRTDSTATSALTNEYIFVVGGEPFSPSGTSIERYSIMFNHWELLSVYLPKPMSKIGIFPITNRRIALIGGTESSHVFILNINEVLVFEGVNYSNDVESVTYSLQDCSRPLDYQTETVFPIAFCRTNNMLYVMNSNKSDPGSLSFTIEKYNVEYFDISSSVDNSHKPYSLIAKVRTPYDLGRTWKNDSNLRMLK